jgi:Putative beta-barrel porin-2, OmpL-like. bbp2
MNPTLLLAISFVLAQVEPPSLPPVPKNGAVLLAPVSHQEPVPSSQNGQKESATPCAEKTQATGCFFHRLLKAYIDEWHPKEENGDSEEPKRRGLPAPFQSPPFPTAEYQGFPQIGVPPDTTKYPLMKALDCTQCGKFLDDNRFRVYGWVNASANWTTNRVTNTPTSYWVAPNSLQMDQTVIRVERQLDTVQRDHIDWGFKATVDYGIDYRYFTAGGWFSRQLLVNNNLYGWDPTELYLNFYCPGVARGLVLTVGRWIACPDIETQFAPDNYMGSHSLQFTVDVYTETGVMASVMLNDQWMVQAAIHAGADMAPWYKGAQPTGMFGARWVSCDNNDSFYTVLNAINNANYQYFQQDGQPSGHHNYNIIQSTWQHRFTEKFFTKTEAYLMWEHDAPVGGTPSLGPVQFGSGGGLGPTIPGTSLTYGVLNYTMFQLSKKDFLVLRNEWMKDENGTRYGYAGNYTSNSIGWTHNFTPSLQFRPEIGYYRNWNTPTFDNGQHKDMFMAAFDVTLRF